jgi:hypothetical protein
MRQGRANLPEPNEAFMPHVGSLHIDYCVVVKVTALGTECTLVH